MIREACDPTGVESPRPEPSGAGMSGAAADHGPGRPERAGAGMGRDAGDPAPARSALPDPGRERLLRRLDEALSAEPPPVGVAPDLLDEEPASDAPDGLHAVWSAVTALTQEVRLQGRAFKQLGDALPPPRRLEEVLEAHADLVEELRSQAKQREETRVREAERRARGELLEVLLDTHERARRGLESARAAARPPTGWLARWRHRPTETVARAILDGAEMSLTRLESALEALDVRPVAARDARFDPHLMVADAVEDTDRVPSGTVVEVLRPGWTWRDELLRPARVRVARSLTDSRKEASS